MSWMKFTNLHGKILFFVQSYKKGINDTIQIDLVEMIPHASVNKGHKYMLTAIDIFSKKGFVRPIRRKTGPEVSKAMNSILHEIGRAPKNIHSDQGKEFFNQTFQNLMSINKINHYHTFTELKASIIERFNRTLKTWMWKRFAFNGNYRWVDFIDELVNKYNNTYHRTIKMTPNQVIRRKEKMLLQTVYRYPNIYRGDEKFSVGNNVRISKYKGIFSKGYEPNWSTEVFTINNIKFTTPITYVLKDFEGKTISGGFYEHELQKVKNPDIYLVEKVLRRKNDKCYVKWLGFDKKHNSWINKRDFY